MGEFRGFSLMGCFKGYLLLFFFPPKNLSSSPDLPLSNFPHPHPHPLSPSPQSHTPTSTHTHRQSPFLTSHKSPNPPTDLSLIGTDPSHERRGAASLLIQWGLERSKRDNIPAYLESTMNAVPLYQRHGFKVAEVISMVVDGVGDGVVKDEDEDEDKDGGDGEGEEGRRRGKKEEEEKVYYYEEMCLLFRPDGRCGDQL